MNKPVTIRDVAQLAGVSTSTVSIVINNHAKSRNITPKTQQRVLDAARILSYRPNASARRMRKTGLPPSIGLFWADDWRETILSRFLSGLRREQKRLDIDIDLSIEIYTPGKLLNNRFFSDVSTADGIILANAADKDLLELSRSFNPIPIVLYNRKLPNKSWVAVDNVEVGRMAADALSGKRGVAIVSPRETVFQGTGERIAALSNALIRQGVFIGYIDTEDYGLAAGRMAADRFDYSKFDAVFLPDDRTAFGFMGRCSELGISIPDDVSVLSIGNDLPENTWLTRPPLSTVDIPMEEMAAACLKMILGQIESTSDEQDRYEEMYVHAQLVDRGSIK